VAGVRAAHIHMLQLQKQQQASVSRTRDSITQHSRASVLPPAALQHAHTSGTRMQAFSVSSSIMHPGSPRRRTTAAGHDLPGMAAAATRGGSDGPSSSDETTPLVVSQRPGVGVRSCGVLRIEA
jgi:hypothetical protein